MKTETDCEKLERLYVQYKPLLMWVAMKIVHSRDLAEDAIHDTFLVAFERKDKILSREPPFFRRWCVIVVRGKCIDILRRRKYYDNAMPLDDVDAMDIASDEMPLDEQMIQREVQQQMMNCAKEAGEPIVCSERHEHRMAAMFARERRREKMSMIATRTVRLAAAAAVIFVVISAALMSAPKVRAAVGGTLVEWFDRFVKFDAHISKTAVFNYEPAYIPDGFAEIFRVQTENIVSTMYTDSSDEYLTFVSQPAANSMSVNNDGIEYRQILDGEIVYHIFEATSGAYESSIVWDMDEYRFNVSAQLPVSELLDIAKSVGH